MNQLQGINGSSGGLHLQDLISSRTRCKPEMGGMPGMSAENWLVTQTQDQTAPVAACNV